MKIHDWLSNLNDLFGIPIAGDNRPGFRTLNTSTRLSHWSGTFYRLWAVYFKISIKRTFNS